MSKIDPFAPVGSEPTGQPDPFASAPTSDDKTKRPWSFDPPSDAFEGPMGDDQTPDNVSKSESDDYHGYTNRLPARGDEIKLPSEYLESLREPPQGADFITDEAIQEIRKLGIELWFEHEHLGRFYLVADHTDLDRPEITWSMLKAILTAQAIFPEIKLAGLRRQKREER